MEENKSDEEQKANDYYIKKPKIYENIETNQSMNNKTNLPKIIPATFKKQDNNEIKISVKDKRNLIENIDKDKNKENINKVDKSASKNAKIEKIDEN